MSYPERILRVMVYIQNHLDEECSLDHLAGVACFLLVSEWPLARIEHWKTLLRARAIENQAFFIAVRICSLSSTMT